MESEFYTANILWNTSFSGEAIIKVKAGNRCGETEAEMAVNVVTNVDEYSIKANLFPNPNHGNFTVEAEGMRRITVSNALGQIVLDEEAEGNRTQINMSQFAAGTYLVRIHTENGTALKRVNVIR